jgi:GDP-L-fucose synthase
MEKEAKIYVAGHRGLVGSAILKTLKESGYTNIITRTRDELDLMSANAVSDFFAKEKPAYVFDAAAKVGGITANNTYPAEFIYENLTIQNNIIHQAHVHGVTKLLFLGSSCIYPKLAPQPIKEEYLLTGLLEPTNEAYALAKIAGIMMCKSYHKQYGSNFISAMPTNLYGPEDNFHPTSSHAIPQIIRKFHEAKAANLPQVTGFTDGSPLREFLHVSDLGKACVYLMENYNDPQPINVGTGEDLPMRDVIYLIAKVVGYEGEIILDGTIPNGTPRKVLDVSRIHELGWHHTIDLETGISETYDWFCKQTNLRGYQN